MTTCEDPAKPAPAPPVDNPKNISYDTKNYVYDLSEEPYENWDF